MPISVNPNEFENITEIWEASPNTIEVVTRSERRIRITARRVIRGPGGGPYHADYKEMTAAGVWARPTTEYPWQNGPTVEVCLRAALSWVNDRERHR